MTMAKSAGAQKPDFEMVNALEKAYVFLKEIFESSKKGKGNPDFSKTIKSPEAVNFWKTVRAISREHDMMYPEAETDPSKDHSKQDEAKKSGSAGTRSKDDRAIYQKDVERDSAKRSLKEVERSETCHTNKLTIPVSSASSSTKLTDSSQTTTGVNADSADEGPSPKLQKDEKDPEKIAADRLKQIMELENENKRLLTENGDLTQKNKQIESLQKKISELESLRDEINEKNEVLDNKYKEVNAHLKGKMADYDVVIESRNEYLKRTVHLENAEKKYQQAIEERDRTIMSLEGNLESLTKDHTDLKNRFSKLAGHKLTDQNPDIADLSDPNRAMKLSEKFGALYDDTWTDAFEQLTDKQKQKPREAIQFLLDRLKECWEMCKRVADSWMASLHHVYLHPIQETDAISKMQGGKQGVRLGSKELRVIRDASRKIGPVVGILVKQYFMLHLKKEHQKLNEACTPYLEGCVDVCWLMVLAEPPLHIDFSIKQGDRFDPNRHAAYSASGETVEFLVWPPLYNAAEGGGMLSKGTVSTERKIAKSSRK